MIDRADQLGHIDPEHYLWCASHKLDATRPAEVDTLRESISGLLLLGFCAHHALLG